MLLVVGDFEIRNKNEEIKSYLREINRMRLLNGSGEAILAKN